ncbi:hypothetical protein M0R45_023389 [Rubus argutus]|uniref:Peptidase S54 rhomboid domain-containing protein n=1 Tax=Rubus argutus TaxID=59490 RepID=A0AAW1WR76_RUBAR
MQRLLSLKLASNVPKKLSNATTTTTTSSLFQFQPHKTLSLTKPPQSQTQNHFFSSFPTHPHNTLTQRIHGFLSNPLLRKHFLLDSANTLLRVSSKRLSDCRLGFLQTQFPKQSFNSNPSHNSHQSARSSWFQTVSSNDMVFGLIMANVVVFLLWRLLDPVFMVENFAISLYSFMVGRLHTLIGRVFGAEFLLKLYLAGAIGGSVFYLVHNAFLHLTTSSEGRTNNIKDPLVIPGLGGASSAVNAIMLLDIFLHPTATFYLMFIIPVPAMLLGIFLIGKDIPRIMEGSYHVSGSTHLGGAAVAAIAWARLRMGLRLF